VKQRIKAFLAGGVLALALFGVAAAGPLEDGGTAYWRGDYAVALQILGPLAEQGNAGAQNYIGLMYYYGLGVPQDYAQAVAWYRKAAEQGYALSQSNLGAMYYQGQGVPQDYAQALAWDRKAAKQGNVIAQNFLRVWCSNNYHAACIGLGKYASAVPLKREGNTYLIPVVINGALALDFIIDSGASDVSIPADVVLTLMRTGTLRNDDFLGSKEYQLADGSKVPSETFMIRTLKVGNRELENVTGSVAGVEGSLLLGQSFLTRFRSWSIDNERGVLLLN
jgi:predicted aspartyl protease